MLLEKGNCKGRRCENTTSHFPQGPCHGHQCFKLALSDAVRKFPTYVFGIVSRKKLGVIFSTIPLPAIFKENGLFFVWKISLHENSLALMHLPRPPFLSPLVQRLMSCDVISSCHDVMMSCHTPRSCNKSLKSDYVRKIA